MKLYNVPKDGLTKEQLEKGHWALYADVTCEDCKFEAALTNAPDQVCRRCGGRML